MLSSKREAAAMQEMVSFNGQKLPFSDIPGGRNSDHTAFKSCTTIQGQPIKGGQSQHSLLGPDGGDVGRNRALTDAISVRTNPNHLNTTTDEKGASPSRNHSKSVGRRTAKSAANRKKSRKEAELELKAKREFKKYALEKKQKLVLLYPSQEEISSRFYELVIRQIEDNGAKLVMNLDFLRETKNDPKVGAIILQEVLRLQHLTLHSDFCGPKELFNCYKRWHQMKRPDPSAQEKASSKKPSHSTTDMYHMMNGLRKNLSSEESQLRSLHLIKLRPVFGPKRQAVTNQTKEEQAQETLLTRKNKDAWELLFMGIAQSQSLLVLRLNHMPINAEVLSTLGEALRFNATLQVLDLAYNGIPDKLGPQLVMLIKDQAEQRDSLKWQGSLRKREGQRGMLDAMKEKMVQGQQPPKGLTEFLFHHNSLGKRFVESLAEEIVTDIYVRKIDVSHNKIPEQPLIDGLVESLKLNESLVNVNLVGNPGLTADVKHKIALCLLKNLEILKREMAPIRVSWIDLKQIEALDDQLNELMQGFSFAEEESAFLRDGNQQVQLLKQVGADSSFQAGDRPINLKMQNKRKSMTSVLSRESQNPANRSLSKANIKARVDVSGDRSIDMFASDINSVSGLPTQQTQMHMNLMDESKDGLASTTKKRGATNQSFQQQKQTQEFSQSGFDLVDRIYDGRKSQNHSMQEIGGVHLNSDLVEEDNFDSKDQGSLKRELIDCRRENQELKNEVTRLTDKLDNIRRLQEMGMLSSFPTISHMDGSSTIGGGAAGAGINHASTLLTIEGHGTMASSKAQTLAQEETSAGAVMDKIQFYTTELHRLLDLVDQDKKTKHARAKQKRQAQSKPKGSHDTKSFL